jgi:hypothetical protein
MKKLVLSLSVGLSVATFMVACNTNGGAAKSEQASAAKVADTSGLAQFQAAKQQEAFAASQFAAVAATPKASNTHVRTVTKYVPAKSSSTNSSSSRSTAPKSTTSKSDSSNVLSQTSENAAKTSQKKGISKAAKGAIIGGVAGAAAGAIINKQNRVVGAVVGGVVGAAGGYGIGRGMDKKDGRYLNTHDFGGYTAQ